MGNDNLEDRTINEKFLSDFQKYRWIAESQTRLENYHVVASVLRLHKQAEVDYINFRLDKYASEGRKVIAEVYKILGYNPYIKNGRQK